MEGDVVVSHAPWSWTPLLAWMRCQMKAARIVFPTCRMVSGLGPWMTLNEQRRSIVESLCTLRPETTDALWKFDNEWPHHPDRTLPYAVGQDMPILVTNGNSFFRSEFKEYLERLHTYTPLLRKVVLVPCAADKPYPSPLHREVLARIPSDWYVCIVTGTLGLVPQDLWHFMPNYDSALPNEWRAFEEVRDYFGKHQHDAVVVYSDFYAEAIYEGLHAACHKGAALYPFPWERGYTPYVDLLDAGRLRRLADIVCGFDVVNRPSAEVAK